jgi:hypothetical protein
VLDELVQQRSGCDIRRPLLARRVEAAADALKRDGSRVALIGAVPNMKTTPP